MDVGPVVIALLLVVYVILSQQVFSTVVPSELDNEPVHMVEAVALLAAACLWVPSLPPSHLVPIGCDNQIGKVCDPRHDKMSRLLWGVFAPTSSTFRDLFVTLCTEHF